VAYSEVRRVRFQDVDAAGIVFFARVFDYFHDAYVGFLRARGVPLEAALRDGSWVAPLSRAEADYRRPLRFGDEVEVRVESVEVSETEYTVRYRIEVDGKTACVGRTRHVSVDPETFRRTPVPERLRRVLEGAGTAGPGDGGPGTRTGEGA
jgi:1,4-dihydroxy-2-naphthoyl-CoA hydrolase